MAGVASLLKARVVLMIGGRTSETINCSAIPTCLPTLLEPVYQSMVQFAMRSCGEIGHPARPTGQRSRRTDPSGHPHLRVPRRPNIAHIVQRPLHGFGKFDPCVPTNKAAQLLECAHVPATVHAEQRCLEPPRWRDRQDGVDN